MGQRTRGTILPVSGAISRDEMSLNGSGWMVHDWAGSPGKAQTFISRMSGFFDQVENFSGGRMAPERLLGKYETTIKRDLKNPARGFQEADLGFRQILLQLGGQTGRPGLVVSDDAEFYCYPHKAFIC